MVLALVALVACWAMGRGHDGEGSEQSQSTGAASPTTVASPDAPQSVGEPSEGELGSGWDRATLSPVPEPSALDADKRSALLRLDATAQRVAPARRHGAAEWRVLHR